RGPVLFAAGLSAVLWDFLFIPPPLTLYITALEDVLMFGMYFVTALVTGSLTGRLRSQEQAARHREAQTAALYALARETASATTMDGVLRTAVRQISQVFDAEVAVWLRGSEDRLSPEPHPVSTFSLSEKERSVASWAFDNGKPAGRFTD